VAVAGGGAIGLAVAWRAAQQGLRVAVLDRDRPGAGASSVAAGMLAPITEASPAEPELLGLGLASAAAYPGFAAELREASGIDPGYLRCGSLLVARDSDEAEALERELELRRSLGLEVTRLRASEARGREPALAPAVRLAIEIPDDHAIDPRLLVRALAAGCARAGVELLAGSEVTAVELGGDRVLGVRLSDGRSLGAEHVVIAAGAWSGLLEQLPAEARVPIRPVKGQILRLHDAAGPGLLGRVLRMAGAYIVPRADGRYVLGATMEERGFDTTVTAGAVFELLREAVELVPGIGELVLDELSAGLRPATPDNLPAIGTGTVPGLHWATGHHRNGILLAPITAELLTASLAGEEASPLAASVSPARFAGAAVGVPG
jgi:glycine oxidase